VFGVILGSVGAVMAFATELVGTRRLGSRADAYLTSGGGTCLPLSEDSGSSASSSWF
jgi:hypothetical protein